MEIKKPEKNDGLQNLFDCQRKLLSYRCQSLPFKKYIYNLNILYLCFLGYAIGT